MTPSRSSNNSEWLAALASSGETQETALADLRAILVSGLRRGLTAWLDPHSPQLEALAEEASQEALVRILARLDTFEGRSRFTTWAYKVAIRIALTDLRRKQWQEVSLDQMLEAFMDEEREVSVIDPMTGPEVTVEQQDLLARIGRILLEELTERQLAMMQAVAREFDGSPPRRWASSAMPIQDDATHASSLSGGWHEKGWRSVTSGDLRRGNAQAGNVVKGEVDSMSV
jgi:RNA polymerase sigma-70 factor (ECF subfamily)